MHPRAQQLLNPMGNLFEDGFDLLEKQLPCSQAWRCPACDRDKVQVMQIG